MADSKVSELTAATSVGGSDQLYLVQSNTSKRVTASTLFENLGNVILRGNVALDPSVQLLATPGIIDLTKTVTHLASDSTGGTLVLPAGKNNQIKVLTMIATTGGTMRITSNIANNANVTFAGVGDTAVLIYTYNKWHIIGSAVGAVTSVTSVNGRSGTVTLYTSNISEVGNLYFTDARARNALSVSGSGLSYDNTTGVITITAGNVKTADLTTANVVEVSNLYFSNARVYDNVSQLGYITASSLNGYATNTQLDSYATVANLDLKANIADLNTSNVVEGGNLYFTSQRVIDSLVGNAVSTGNLTVAGSIVLTANSAINSLANTSGDGLGLTTLELVPDNSVYVNDQYLIIDPTAPSHIHIRAGGSQDSSSTQLFVGGENSYLSVGAGFNPTVYIASNNNLWFFNTDGSLNAPGTISSSGLTSTGRTKVEKVIESYSGVVDPVGDVTLSCSSTHIFNITSINTNFTANFTDLGLGTGEATSLTLVLNQGGTAYIANAVQIGGVTQTIKWQSNAQPTGNVNAIDIQTFSILNVSGNYTVLGQLTTFG